MPDIKKDVARIDKARIIGLIKQTDDGYLQGTAVVARSGILEYYEGGKIVRELVDPEELAKADSVNTLKMKPVTNNHPSTRSVNPDNVKQFQVGFTGETTQCDGQLLSTSITINDKNAIAEVNGGKRELSAGYVCDEIEEPGVWQGQAYDRRQTNRRYNHVAICDLGRAGNVASLHLDAADVYECGEANFKDNSHNDHSPQKRRNPMPVQITVKGIQYADQAPEVAAALAESLATIETLKKEKTDGIAGVQTKLDAMTAERDATKTKLDAANTEIAALPGKINAAGKARAELVAQAKPHLDVAEAEKIDSLSDAEIMLAVATKAFPDAKEKIAAVKKDNADAVRIWYDAALTTTKNDNVDNAARQNRQAVVDPKNDNADHINGCKCDACVSKEKPDINDMWKKNKKDSFTKKQEAK